MEWFLAFIFVAFILNNVGFPQTGVIQFYSSDSMPIGTVYKTNKGEYLKTIRMLLLK